MAIIWVQKVSTILDIMALKCIETPVMLSVTWSINYSEGTSSAPASVTDPWAYS